MLCYALVLDSTTEAQRHRGAALRTVTLRLPVGVGPSACPTAERSFPVCNGSRITVRQNNQSNPKLRPNRCHVALAEAKP